MTSRMASASVQPHLNTRIAELVRDSGGALRFAAKCGVSPSAVRKWLLPDADLKLSNLLRIVQETNVSLSWLATGIGPKSAGDSNRYDDLGRSFEAALLNVDVASRQRALAILKLEVGIEGRVVIASNEQVVGATAKKTPSKGTTAGRGSSRPKNKQGR